MAVYKAKNIKQVPIRYLANGGAEATHETEQDELAREKDNPNTVASTWKLVNFGDFAFTEAADYDALSEQQAARSTYSPFPSFYAEQLRFGGVEEVEAGE